MGALAQEKEAIARPAQQSAPTREGPRVNGEIKAPQVRLIDENGDMVGVVSTREAIDMAEEASLDLIEISPNAVPPVAKISDYGKYKYEAQKKAHEARKHQKVIEVKEIKMRPNIDDHDYEVKMRAMKRFIEEGDKVKVTLRFRGREMVHSELGLQVLNRVRGEMDPLTKIESMPRMEGRQMIMVAGAEVATSSLLGDAGAASRYRCCAIAQDRNARLPSNRQASARCRRSRRRTTSACRSCRTSSSRSAPGRRR